MKNLAKEIRKCTKCDLHKTCIQKVVGRGVSSPKILWIGEASGKLEDETGKPFCGPSGQLLDKWMKYLDVVEESAVTNVLKCRPLENRDPKPFEIASCHFWLERQIKILDPEIIVAVGRFAMKEILSFDKGITNFAGRCFTKEGRKVFVMPHPSYYLRNGGKGWEKPLESIKRFLDNDVIGVSSESVKEGIREEKLIEELVISEKFQEKLNEVRKGEFTEYDGIEDMSKDLGLKTEKNNIPDFVPLHAHTMYSVGDGCGKIQEFVNRIQELGYKSFAITDHGTLSGTYKFQTLCEEKGIKPILGCEFYVTDKYEKKNRVQEHLVLLAKNEVGLRNLFKLGTLASEHYYYKPIITLEDVFAHKEGLIATSACVSGILGQKVMDGENNKAYEVAKTMKREFGDDFYVEIQYHDFPLQKKVNKVLIQLAEDLDIELVMMPDIHFIKKEDIDAHIAVKAIAYRKKVSDNPGFSSTEYFIPTPLEAYKLSQKVNIPEGIIEKSFENTIKIAELCNARIEKEKDAIPRFGEVKS